MGSCFSHRFYKGSWWVLAFRAGFIKGSCFRPLRTDRFFLKKKNEGKMFLLFAQVLSGFLVGSWRGLAFRAGFIWVLGGFSLFAQVL